MNKKLCAVLSLLVTLAVPVSMFAKGRTVKITITGVDLAAPIELADETIGQFGVWEGPGVTINGVPQNIGFIIEWANGVIAERRKGLQHYEVSFHVGCKMSESGCRTENSSLAYVVSYEYDPSSKQGYVHLPGKGDKWYQLNATTILRGLEGNWFLATSDWQRVVGPLLEQATAANRAAR